MANKMVGAIDGLGFVNKQRTGSNTTSTATLSSGDYSSISAMRTALAASSLSAYYTSAVLDRMTTNDMVYAMRVLVDNGIATNGVI